jgi:hypothetical protein
MKKVLILFTLLASLGLHALTEKEKAIAFMKDWVTFANGKMEVYQRNVVTGKVRLLTLVFNRRLSAVLIIVFRSLSYANSLLNNQATNTRVFLKNIYLIRKCPAF